MEGSTVKSATLNLWIQNPTEPRVEDRALVEHKKVVRFYIREKYSTFSKPFFLNNVHLVVS